MEARTFSPPLSGDNYLSWLIGRSARGDAAAFQALYERTKHRVAYAVWQICGADMENAVADAYAQLRRQALSYDAASSNPMGWILALARASALRHARRETETPASGHSSGHSGRDGSQDWRGAAQVQVALDRLTREESWLLRLAFWQVIAATEVVQCFATLMAFVHEAARVTAARLTRPVPGLGSNAARHQWESSRS